MTKKLFLAIFFITFLGSSASRIGSQPKYTIREKFNKVVEEYVNNNLTIVAHFRMEDKNCLEENLKLKNPENEINKKFVKSDINAILEGAGAVCNEDVVKDSQKNLLDMTFVSGYKYIDPNIDCLKNELFKLDSTATILEGFIPDSAAANSEDCNIIVKQYLSTLESRSEEMMKETEFPQCLSSLSPVDVKVIKLKIGILTGDIYTEQKFNDESQKIGEFFKNGVVSIFNCIMNEASKSE